MSHPATLDFIRQHQHDDIRQLALLGSKLPEVDLPYALDQIAGRQKARTKLPSWAAIEGMVYPPHLSMEQCSSELTARYKAGLAGNGHLLVDLTGGFGVDFAFMAEGFHQAVYVERQAQLCAISSENFDLLGLRQAEVVCADATDYLPTLPHADLIFLDPARRDGHGGRTYGISDCTPNVLELKDELLRKADRTLLKLSPMLDWQKAVSDIGPCVSEVHIVSVDNECKELLVMVEGGGRTIEGDRLRVVCVNLLSDGSRQHFDYVPATLIPPSSTSIPTPKYLYEPNASLMKAGCFSLLEERFGVVQLERNSHLFVSDKPVMAFPGRQFEILRVTTMNKHDLKENLSDVHQANIAVRNFPMTVADLRKRLKLKDGGNLYIFATTIARQGHRLLICRKIG